MRIFKYVGFGLLVLFALIGMLFVGVYIAMEFGLLNVRGSISERNQFFKQNSNEASGTPVCADTKAQQCAWNKTPEWAVIKEGLRKDQLVIKDVSQKTGVPARLIAASAVPEQVRFFTAEREVFKRYFEPLKILGSMSQFSLGVTGIKEATAQKIESNVSSTTSVFYPGPSFSTLIAYQPGINQKSELYNRLTNPKDHYYSYLYTALFLKEIEVQWKVKGFDITKNPGALVTLFNVGFAASNPNAAPKIGGAAITTGNKTYTYGELGELFYTSSELAAEFPA